MVLHFVKRSEWSARRRRSKTSLELELVQGMVRVWVQEMAARMWVLVMVQGLEQVKGME